ncbi:MAG: hypothetical protein ABIQ18_14420 [Umezawaea sp.]
MTDPIGLFAPRSISTQTGVPFAESKSMLVVTPSSSRVLPQSPFSSVQLPVTVVAAVGMASPANWRLGLKRFNPGCRRR